MALVSGVEEGRRRCRGAGEGVTRGWLNSTKKGKTRSWKRRGELARCKRRPPDAVCVLADGGEFKLTKMTSRHPLPFFVILFLVFLSLSFSFVRYSHPTSHERTLPHPSLPPPLPQSPSSLLVRALFHPAGHSNSHPPRLTPLAPPVSRCRASSPEAFPLKKSGECGQPETTSPRNYRHYCVLYYNASEHPEDWNKREEIQFSFFLISLEKIWLGWLCMGMESGETVLSS